MKELWDALERLRLAQNAPEPDYAIVRQLMRDVDWYALRARSRVFDEAMRVLIAEAPQLDEAA